MKGSRVVAVVVAYQPALDLLEQVLLAIAPQVANVVVVDNGWQSSLVDWHRTSEMNTVSLLVLNENRGIAAAQNMGIEWARKQGAEFVLLLDQDSVPAPDMVDQLIHAIADLPFSAAAGPQFLDARLNVTSTFTRVCGLRLQQTVCSSGEMSVIPADYLIASGSLIPMSVLDEVGGMREDLFIDYVDIEWCLRAHHHGFQSYGVCSAHLHHSLGGDPIKFFGKNIPLHNPLRSYYQFRNAVLLYKEPRIPLNWKLADGWRLCRRYIFYALFAKPRMAYWRLMTLGILHGLAGRTGKFEGRMVRPE